MISPAQREFLLLSFEAQAQNDDAFVQTFSLNPVRVTPITLSRDANGKAILFAHCRNGGLLREPRNCPQPT